MSDGIVQLIEPLSRLRGALVVTLAPEELTALLGAATVLSEDDTGGGRMIRVLELASDTLVQEQTPRGELLLRRFSSVPEARRFVDERLAIYERMWDGCGCKIDYYS